MAERRRKFMVQAWLGLLLGLFLWGQAGAQVVEARDERGYRVQLAAPPQRIVSLFPALTETVCALGACERLVGVDRYSNWPAVVNRLPRLGGGLDPNIEAVLALKPDLVLIAQSSRAADTLRQLGLPVLTLEPQRMADVQRVLLQVARVLGLPDDQAEAVWQRIPQALAAQARRLPAFLKSQRAYFEVNAAPYGASASSFVGEVMQGLGLDNILPASMGAFPKLNPEFIVRADPDWILLGDSHATALSQRPGWSALRAVRLNQVCAFSTQEADVLVRPGPRLAEGARLLADCLLRAGPPGTGRSPA